MYTSPSDEVFEKEGLAGLLDPICEIAELYTSLSLSLSLATGLRVCPRKLVAEQEERSEEA